MKKFMVIERFKAGCWDAAYARFNSSGRMLPSGLNYLNSWPSRENSVCYQLMETNSPELFELWFAQWNDLVEFELVPID
ncbi:DUF3303 family protein [Kiloniella laminariae]|uniref:DUF3303 family protein n=1 Tax=Kiloniella laminariae TaxID=454162 RepID=A0ABT4LHX6_9PROT|nr:DUF3303 family protein [Kiloniella laminariae]MCZ4279612.1 DUF3303 family protein [Kiloniella laminariae]